VTRPRRTELPIRIVKITDDRPLAVAVGPHSATLSPMIRLGY
jgi:hypothetical protein